MQRWNRYLIFYVIVAVGLVLSWGQIGRKYAQLGPDGGVRLLRVEDDCTLERGSCAAYRENLGMVADLRRAVEGSLLLRLRFVNPQALPLLGVKAGIHSSGSREPISLTELFPNGDDSWQGRLPPFGQAGAYLLRVESILGGERSSTDFPLDPAAIRPIVPESGAAPQSTLPNR